MLPLPTVRLDAHQIHVANRHPVTEVGIGFLIPQLMSNVERALATREGQIRDIGQETVDGRQTRKVELLLGRQASGYYAARALLWLDPQTGLPIQFETFDERGRMIEQYAYVQLRINIGLGPLDFDKRNPQYRF